MRTLMIKFLTLSVPLLLWSIGCGSEGPGSSAALDRVVQQLGVALANNEANAFSYQLGSTAPWSNALVEARKIDIEALNAEEPGFGNKSPSWHIFVNTSKRCFHKTSGTKTGCRILN